jgi:hypothetical protein
MAMSAHARLDIVEAGHADGVERVLADVIGLAGLGPFRDRYQVGSVDLTG